MEYQKIILPKLKPCAICGSSACDRTFNDGIGDIGCSNDKCRKTYQGCHYSGKFCTKKRDAMKCWNENNEILKLQYESMKQLADSVAEIMFRR